MKKRILSLFLAMFFVASFVGVACAIQGTVASVNVGQGSVTINVEGTAILPNGQELEFHIGNERLTGTVASFQNGTLTASVNQSDAAKFMPKRNQTVTFSKKVAK